MAGIYIHIPFCRKACHYCNFHFSTTLDRRKEMVDAIASEIVIRKNEINEPIETLYFGGGTPSILDTADIAQLLNQINKHFHLAGYAEITLEANPDDISAEKARDWNSMGINRFSIGIQSFSDASLTWMNRAHHAQQARDCIKIIRNAGFENFSIDLIYGTPGQDTAAWESDLDEAIRLHIPHLSCYALTMEEGTALHHLTKSGRKEAIDTDLQALQFEILVTKTETAGYHHYEISNLALPGYESRHNSSYWQGKPYLGFGPSAHSFDGIQRSWNISNNNQYITSLNRGERPFEAEVLTDRDRFNEYVMTSLRTSKGIEASRLMEGWGATGISHVQDEIKQAMGLGHVLFEDNHWRLSKAGRFFADGIAASLFL